VSENSGPGPADLDSILWMYHSHTDEARDTYSGLFGGILIYPASSEMLSPDSADQEVVAFFSVINEAKSLFAQDNIEE